MRVFKQRNNYLFSRQRNLRHIRNSRKLLFVGIIGTLGLATTGIGFLATRGPKDEISAEREAFPRFIKDLREQVRQLEALRADKTGRYTRRNVSRKHLKTLIKDSKALIKKYPFSFAAEFKGKLLTRKVAEATLSLYFQVMVNKKHIEIVGMLAIEGDKIPKARMQSLQRDLAYLTRPIPHFPAKATEIDVVTKKPGVFPDDPATIEVIETLKANPRFNSRNERDRILNTLLVLDELKKIRWLNWNMAYSDAPIIHE